MNATKDYPLVIYFIIALAVHLLIPGCRTSKPAAETYLEADDKLLPGRYQFRHEGSDMMIFDTCTADVFLTTSNGWRLLPNPVDAARKQSLDEFARRFSTNSAK
jgi:hypothetical protein